MNTLFYGQGEKRITQPKTEITVLRLCIMLSRLHCAQSRVKIPPLLQLFGMWPCSRNVRGWFNGLRSKITCAILFWCTVESDERNLVYGTCVRQTVYTKRLARYSKDVFVQRGTENVWKEGKRRTILSAVRKTKYIIYFPRTNRMGRFWTGIESR